MCAQEAFSFCYTFMTPHFSASSKSQNTS